MMGDFLWVLPVLGCGVMMVMMVVMMWGMGKGMFSGDKEDGAAANVTLDELHAEQQRLGEEIERLQGRDPAGRERETSTGSV